MSCHENGMYGAVYRLTNFSDTLRPIGGKCVKSILTNCTKCNGFNICHTDMQKHVSYEKWFK